MHADYADFLFEVLIYDYNLVDKEKSGLVTAKITFTPFTNSFGSEDSWLFWRKNEYYSGDRTKFIVLSENFVRVSGISSTNINGGTENETYPVYNAVNQLYFA